MNRIKHRVGAIVCAGALIATLAGVAAAVPSSATPLPSIVPGSASTPEGTLINHYLVLPVTLSAASTVKVTAHWQTEYVPGAPGNQADPSNDYVPASGTVSFPRGQTAATVKVLILADGLLEPDEFFDVAFSSPTNATIGGSGIGVGTILNDDLTRVVPGAASAFEGNSGTTVVNVPVTLSDPSSSTVTAQWETVSLSGAPGNQADPATDYTPTSGTVTFTPGDTAETVPISINGDTLVEPDEYIVVAFGDPTNAQMGGFWGLGFGIISNDDGLVTTTCPSGTCAGPTITSPDGSTQLQVTAGPSDGPDIVTEQVGGNLTPMLCTLPDSGALLAEFHTTADVSKVVNYTVFGDAATFAENFLNSHFAVAGDISTCYGSVDEFNGWSPAPGGNWSTGPYVYGPAPFDPSTGLHEAFLGSCANHEISTPDGPVEYQPCFVNQQGPGFNTAEIHAPASVNDPRASN